MTNFTAEIPSILYEVSLQRTLMLRGRIVVQLVSRSTSLLYVWSESAKLEASHALAPVVSVLWSWSRTGAVGKHHRDVSRCIQSSPVDASIDCTSPVIGLDVTSSHGNHCSDLQSCIMTEWYVTVFTTINCIHGYGCCFTTSRCEASQQQLCLGGKC